MKELIFLQIQFSIDDSKAARVLAAHGVADAAALRDLLKAQVLARTREYEAQTAAGAAERTARAKADADFGGVS